MADLLHFFLKKPPRTRKNWPREGVSVSCITLMRQTFKDACPFAHDIFAPVPDRTNSANSCTQTLWKLIETIRYQIKWRTVCKMCYCRQLLLQSSRLSSFNVQVKLKTSLLPLQKITFYLQKLRAHSHRVKAEAKANFLLTGLWSFSFFLLFFHLCFHIRSV